MCVCAHEWGHTQRPEECFRSPGTGGRQWWASILVPGTEPWSSARTVTLHNHWTTSSTLLWNILMLLDFSYKAGKSEFVWYIHYLCWYIKIVLKSYYLSFGTWNHFEVVTSFILRTNILLHHLLSKQEGFGSKVNSRSLRCNSIAGWRGRGCALVPISLWFVNWIVSERENRGTSAGTKACGSACSLRGLEE